MTTNTPPPTIRSLGQRLCRNMQRTTAVLTFALPLRPVLRKPRAPRPLEPRYVTLPFHIRHSCVNRAIVCTSSPPTGNTPHVHIRHATKEDIPKASRVLASAFSQDFVTHEPTTLPILTILLPVYEMVARWEIANQLRQRVKHDKHVILLAEVDQQTVGCAEVGVLDIASLTKRDDVKDWGKGGREAYVGNLGVLSQYRGRGIGRSLIENAERVARGWGLGYVWLCVEARNGAAVRFYERLGFRCVAREPDWFDEIGKRRRLFLCSGKGMDVGEWDKARLVGGKLGVIEYLRYCLLDLRKRREATEGRTRDMT